MTMFKVMIRDLLGLIVIISTILATLGILLDLFVVFAYFTNETTIANMFFHESFYLLAFLIPPYFIAKYITNSQRVADVEAYLLLKHKNEHS